MGKVGRMKKEGSVGMRKAYVTRSKALRKLQLNLKDFRRLCILKGVYPVEPKNKNKVGGPSAAFKTYYYLSDILMLSHEPIIWKFWDFKIFMRKMRRARGRREKDTMKQIKDNRPFYKVDHIVRERYPTFVDTLRDMDDALSMTFLYANLPQVSDVVPVDLIDVCRRVTVEFMHYIIETRSLRKCFISIKGYYFQVNIHGQDVTWVMPHKFAFHQPADVDLNVMKTFTEFYATLIGFVNYKLFSSINLYYPPKVVGISQPAIPDAVESNDEAERDLELIRLPSAREAARRKAEAFELLASLNVPLDRTRSAADDDDAKPDDFDLSVDEGGDDGSKPADGDTGDPTSASADTALIGTGPQSTGANYLEIQQFQQLFEGKKFFLGREIPREHFTFVIRSFGGQVSWDATSSPGSTYQETDPTIDFQLVDRPTVTNRYLNRTYVQPQWVFDSVNCGILLPTDRYFPGQRIPPHLSPFVRHANPGSYMPEEKINQLRLMGKPIPAGCEMELAKMELLAAAEAETGSRKRAVESKPTSGRQDQEDSDAEDQEGGEMQVDDQDSDQEESDDADKDDKDLKSATAVKVENKRQNRIAVRAGRLHREPSRDEAAEAKRLAVMMIPKKKRRLYERIMKSQKRHTKVKRNLQRKRIAVLAGNGPNETRGPGSSTTTTAPDGGDN